ncbi:hypothetical protein DBR43_03795 [Pedobacter sp. KBW06]|uniref:hypothetical protein n=1 Tax=Pedobacter sp. KBW06 TaxID=2153359 RepID=UPI000F59FC53|nr:hypothetical protein [Pedobacter sp. KBW06]RQO74524.1 hypothetical protein DBR43_03795 [Pedobacter sp. KBW06]
MAKWENMLEDDESSFVDPKFEDIQSLFLAGKIKKMYQLVKRSPTKIAELLGINYDSYHTKLMNPEKFTTLHINTMAYVFKIDPNIINDVIQSETLEKVMLKVKNFEEKTNK